MASKKYFYKHIQSELKELEHYHEGGYYPAILGERLPPTNPRYRIVQKLAAGENATIWLARDMLGTL
jgi:hypothetical protein